MVRVVNDARKAKTAMLDGVNNPTPRQINLATAAGNRVMAEAARQVGVESVPQYIKDQKEAAKNKHAQRNKSHSRNRQATNAMENVKQVLAITHQARCRQDKVFRSMIN